MDPVGQLDHQDPNIPTHGHNHLADGLGLGRITVVHLRYLGDPIDQTGHRITELLPALVKGVVGVFDRVVQETRRYHGRPHAQVGQDLCHGKGVDDVWLPRFAPLVGMLPDRTVIGLLEHGEVFVGMVGPTYPSDGGQRIERIVAHLAPQGAGRQLRRTLAAHVIAADAAFHSDHQTSNVR